MHVRPPKASRLQATEPSTQTGRFRVVAFPSSQWHGVTTRGGRGRARSNSGLGLPAPRTSPRAACRRSHEPGRRSCSRRSRRQRRNPLLRAPAEDDESRRSVDAGRRWACASRKGLSSWLGAAGDGSCAWSRCGTTARIRRPRWWSRTCRNEKQVSAFVRGGQRHRELVRQSCPLSD